MMHCVIGSGPAAVACAKALEQRGVDVLMVDAGLELEPERARIVRELAEARPSAWPPAQVARVKEGMAAGTKGIPLKLLFGSDYPYRETEQHIPWQGQNVGLRPSLALGGFSTVWGAAMLPYRDADIDDWPIKSSALEKHYRAVAVFTGLAGQRDDLEELFPLYCDDPRSLQPSGQASRLLGNLERHRAGLRERGWRFGRARLAVRAADTPKGSGCVYCGLCVYGCPYGCIYNSADTVNQWLLDKKLTYRRDVIVTSLREQPGQVTIEGFHRRTHAPLSFAARRVYLAGGVIPTAQILLRSRAAYDRPLFLRDSQYFLFPLVLARRTRAVQTESLYTLSQLFIEICRPEISRRTVHLQVYTYSDLVGQAVRKTLGPLARPLEFMARQIEERMVIIQGYLHSDESQTITLTRRSRNQEVGADWRGWKRPISPRLPSRVH